MAQAYTVLLGSASGSMDAFIAQSLQEQGYIVHTAEDPEVLLHSITSDVDLVVLSILAAQDLSLVAQIRARSQCAIIVIGPTRAAQLLIGALENGADDYVQRPFRTDELLARLRARLRRAHQNDEHTLVLGSLTIDLHSRYALRNGSSVEISSLEYILLTTLASQPRQAFRATYLAEQLWGGRASRNIDTLDAMIHRLRALIEYDPNSPRILCGDGQQGYWLDQSYLA